MDRKDEIGNVYAIITTKGYAFGQVAGINEEKWSGMYHCRIFSKLYSEIPENISDIIAGKEDYVMQIELPSMARRKFKMAKKIGKFPFPESYMRPKYVRSSLTIGEDGSNAPFKRWLVIPDFGTIVERIRIDEWVTKVLGKNLYDETWKDDFKKLNPSSIFNGSMLIEMLENGWKLEKWLPNDFHMNSKYLWAEYVKGD